MKTGIAFLSASLFSVVVLSANAYASSAVTCAQSNLDFHQVSTSPYSYGFTLSCASLPGAPAYLAVPDFEQVEVGFYGNQNFFFSTISEVGDASGSGHLNETFIFTPIAGSPSSGLGEMIFPSVSEFQGDAVVTISDGYHSYTFNSNSPLTTSTQLALFTDTGLTVNIVENSSDVREYPNTIYTASDGSADFEFTLLNASGQPVSLATSEPADFFEIAAIGTPEPASLGMIGLGVGLVACAARKKNKAKI